MKKKIWFINAGTVNLKERLYDYEDDGDFGIDGPSYSVH